MSLRHHQRTSPDRIHHKLRVPDPLRCNLLFGRIVQQTSQSHTSRKRTAPPQLRRNLQSKSSLLAEKAPGTFFTRRCADDGSETSHVSQMVLPTLLLNCPLAQGVHASATPSLPTHGTGIGARPWSASVVGLRVSKVLLRRACLERMRKKAFPGHDSACPTSFTMARANCPANPQSAAVPRVCWP